MQTQTPAEFYALAEEWVEKYYGTRAASRIEEGNQERAELKAQLLNEFVDFTLQIREMQHEFPALVTRCKISLMF